jgi:hypothetical protein
MGRSENRHRIRLFPDYVVAGILRYGGNIRGRALGRHGSRDNRGRAPQHPTPPRRDLVAKSLGETPLRSSLPCKAGSEHRGCSGEGSAKSPRRGRTPPGRLGRPSSPYQDLPGGGKSRAPLFAQGAPVESGRARAPFASRSPRISRSVFKSSMPGHDEPRVSRLGAALKAARSLPSRLTCPKWAGVPRPRPIRLLSRQYPQR